MYDATVPNLVRSLIGGFVVFNPIQLHKDDGSGYKYFADKVIEVDAYNPQIAARFAKFFSFLPKLDERRKDLVAHELHRILEVSHLSNDTKEVITKNLN